LNVFLCKYTVSAPVGSGFPSIPKEKGLQQNHFCAKLVIFVAKKYL